MQAAAGCCTYLHCFLQEIKCMKIDGKNPGDSVISPEMEGPGSVGGGPGVEVEEALGSGSGDGCALVCPGLGDTGTSLSRGSCAGTWPAAGAQDTALAERAGHPDVLRPVRGCPLTSPPRQRLAAMCVGCHVGWDAAAPSCVSLNLVAFFFILITEETCSGTRHHVCECFRPCVQASISLWVAFWVQGRAPQSGQSSVPRCHPVSPGAVSPPHGEQLL